MRAGYFGQCPIGSRFVRFTPSCQEVPLPLSFRKVQLPPLRQRLRGTRWRTGWREESAFDGMVDMKSIFASWCGESLCALPGEDVFGETLSRRD
jgi:hypothetical protein